MGLNLHHHLSRSLFVGFFVFITFVLSNNTALSQDGKALFLQKCASCHAIDKDLTGPALKGIEDRVTDKKLLYSWIRNNQKVLASGNKYFNDLYAQWNKTQMTLFEDLSDKEIDAVLTYIREWKPAVKPVATQADNSADDSSNVLWLAALTFFLLIIVLLLKYINTNLKKQDDDKIGFEPLPHVPFYRNKIYLTIAIFVVVAFIAVYLVTGAVELGRNQNYQPEQPIFYSHKVHAGVNQINCLYCHTSAQQGKFASVPSVSTCMNCHMAINEYKGEPIYKENGDAVNGTQEIKKLYAYTGWDAEKRAYTKPATPIKWVRIHNLPDHVLFNHGHHVVNAKVQCQTCHGEIQNMHEVKQFSDLSMGWCINCHRQTKVQFKENGYYAIFEKYHQQMKEGKIDAVTAEMVGANECQKCHY